MNWNKTVAALRKSSPLLCTLLGVTGVVVTAVLTAKGTPKAIELIQSKQETSTEPLKPIEKIVAAAPAYIPAAGVGALTIVSIIGANVLSHKQNLSLAAALTLMKTNYKDYRQKVKELFGDEADKKVQTEISKDRFDPSKIQRHPNHGMDELYIWMDNNTGQIFEATEAEVIQAEYDVNRLLNKYGSCSLAEYCKLLGIEVSEGDEEVGWDVEDFMENWGGEYYWIDFEHILVESSEADMPPYYLIHTPVTPEWNFKEDRRPGVDLYIDDHQCYAYDVR